MILFDDVVKTYPNGTQAIKNLSFSIMQGEFVFLMGSSGAGKSTIIKLLMKEEKPTKGKIIVNGRDLSKIRRSGIHKYRRSIGVVFQDFRLLENKNVFNNVSFAMEIVGNSTKEIREQVNLALLLVGLKNKAKNYPNQLSGGEQQRVALARAIVNAPRLIIADEPTGNLDPENSKEIMRLLEEINSKGITVMIATHEQELAQKMGKKIIMLDHGKIDDTDDDSLNEGVQAYE
ncbi:MAG: cell division ATP-binding protein FtsE [Clostridiales bacterium]|jgi:cell division transport system ATP-binding protein|nr:cell division ATP-binding protein FtsE [Clostridiales bacterium]